MINLPDALLDKLWAQWHMFNGHSNPYFTTNYARVSRRSGDAQQFENWIFAQGGVVQRINKKCYIQFSDEEEALVFRLKYS